MKNHLDIELQSSDSKPFGTRLVQRQPARGRTQWFQSRWQLGSVLVLLGAVLVLAWLFPRTSVPTGESQKTLNVVSYAYSEGSPHEVRNLEFFLRHGLFDDPDTLFFIVVNGGRCTPCNKLQGARPNIHFEFRENYGLDFGAHGHVLNYLEIHGLLARLRRFYCLNASVRGPFLAKYARRRPWTAVFDELFRDNVAAVGASLVCLPKEDAGGPGARLEGFAFALNHEGMRVARRAGVFRPYRTKRDTILNAEFGLTEAIFRAGLSVDTLMTKYQRIWNTSNEMVSCNRHVFPSRTGAVDGFDLHPYEVVFVKAQWHMSYPHLLLYSEWMDHPDAPEPPDIKAYLYFQKEKQVHPIEAPHVASPPIGRKKLVVAVWDRPASAIEWDNIRHFLSHIRRSVNVDYMLVVRDAEVAETVQKSRLDKYPNVWLIQEDPNDLTSVCLQGLSVLRLNYHFLSYNFFVFVTQHARGPSGVQHSGLNWLAVLERRHAEQNGGLLFSFIHTIADSLQPDPSFFCTDQKGLNFLLRGAVCNRRGVTGVMAGMKRVAADALARSVPFGSLQPGEPVVRNLSNLQEPDLREKFSKSLTELSPDELEKLIFAPIASICVSDIERRQLMGHRTERFDQNQTVMLTALQKPTVTSQKHGKPPYGNRIARATVT
jgi:hypothetical protein